MAHRILGSTMLAASALLIAACASQPAATTALDDRYFQREANNYLKFEHEGQVVYCQNNPQSTALIAYKRCVTEAGLRQMVETLRRSRNPVMYTQVRERG